MAYFDNDKNKQAWEKRLDALKAKRSLKRGRTDAPALSDQAAAEKTTVAAIEPISFEALLREVYAGSSSTAIHKSDPTPTLEMEHER